MLMKTDLLQLFLKIKERERERERKGKGETEKILNHLNIFLCNKCYTNITRKKAD